jgi:hypothetical protein
MHQLILATASLVAGLPLTMSRTVAEFRWGLWQLHQRGERTCLTCGGSMPPVQLLSGSRACPICGRYLPG